MQEGLNEWLELDNENLKFHMGQYERPYRSTVKFQKFLKRKVSTPGNVVLDLGCGAGAALSYLISDKDLFKKGVGIDINKDLVKMGNHILRERGIDCCELIEGDIFNLDKSICVRGGGIITLQTFNILPDYREFARCMCELEPDWMAFSTLGFEGMIDYEVRLYDYTKDKDGECAQVFYNIYSIPKMKEHFRDLGYYKFDYEEFEIDIDLPQTNKMGRGTYTVKTEDGKRIQISGGMMMPWYFVFVEK